MQRLQEQPKGKIGIDDLAQSLFADEKEGEMVEKEEATGNLIKGGRERVGALDGIKTRSDKTWKREKVTIH
jgi:hypothetical protein